MDTAGLVLLIPDKADVERDAVAEQWARAGGTVLRIGRFWDPPQLNGNVVRLYGNDTFCLILAQKLNLQLISPADELILTLPAAWLRRRLQKRTVHEALGITYPAFVKPLTPKVFRARVYASATELEHECSGLQPCTQVITSDCVEFTAEARAFVLDKVVLDCAVYEGQADVGAATAFARTVADLPSAPNTYVVDVGLVRDSGWAVIEFNATWGAGLNGCHPGRVVSAIARATGTQVLTDSCHDPGPLAG